MRLFNLNNPFMRGMSKVADLIILNFLFLICSIPIITIGPTLTALYCVTMKLVRNEEEGIAKAFFRSFRLNLRQGILINLLFFVIICVLVADFWFTLYPAVDHGIITPVLFVCAALLAVIAVMTLLYVYPVLAKFDNSVKETLKISFVLSVRHWPNTLAIAALAAFPIWFMTVPNEAVVGFLFLMLILGFAAITLAQSFFLRKVFDKYVPDQQPDNTVGEES